jgi:hypothetical protein
MKTITKITPASISVFTTVPDKVSGIAYSAAKKTLAFFCYETGDIGFVDSEKMEYIPRRLEIPSPMGMYCDEQGGVIFQASPNMLWKFDQLFHNGLVMCGSSVYFDLSAHTYFGNKKASVPVSICRIASSMIAVAIPLSNKIAYLGSATATVVGCGKRGFSMSNNFTTITMDKPSGLCFDSSQKELFVADTGNGIIRRIKFHKEAIPIGMPKDLRIVDGDILDARFSSPSIMKMHNKKIMIVDGQTIRAIDLKVGKVSTLYVSPKKIIDIALYVNDIFVLEAE